MTEFISPNLGNSMLPPGWTLEGLPHTTKAQFQRLAQAVICTRFVPILWLRQYRRTRKTTSVAALNATAAVHGPRSTVAGASGQSPTKGGRRSPPAAAPSGAALSTSSLRSCSDYLKDFPDDALALAAAASNTLRYFPGEIVAHHREPCFPGMLLLWRGSVKLLTPRRVGMRVKGLSSCEEPRGGRNSTVAAAVATANAGEWETASSSTAAGAAASTTTASSSSILRGPIALSDFSTVNAATFQSYVVCTEACDVISIPRKALCDVYRNGTLSQGLLRRLSDLSLGRRQQALARCFPMDAGRIQRSSLFRTLPDAMCKVVLKRLVPECARSRQILCEPEKFSPTMFFVRRGLVGVFQQLATSAPASPRSNTMDPAPPRSPGSKRGLSTSTGRTLPPTTTGEDAGGFDAAGSPFQPSIAIPPTVRTAASLAAGPDSPKRAGSIRRGTDAPSGGGGNSSAAYSYMRHGVPIRVASASFKELGKLIGVLREGATFGERELFFREKVRVTVVALSNCDLYSLSLADLNSLRQENASVAALVAAAASQQREEDLTEVDQHGEALRQFVARIPVLERFASPTVMDELKRLLRPRVLNTGQRLVSRAEHCDRLIILTRGTARVHDGGSSLSGTVRDTGRRARGGNANGLPPGSPPPAVAASVTGAKKPSAEATTIRRRRWSFFELGECIGYTCLLEHRWRYLVTAVEPVDLWELPRDDYIALLKRHGRLYDLVLGATRQLMQPLLHMPNRDPSLDGIIFQLPRPNTFPHLKTPNVYETSFTTDVGTSCLVYKAPTLDLAVGGRDAFSDQKAATRRAEQQQKDDDGASDSDDNGEADAQSSRGGHGSRAKGAGGHRFLPLNTKSVGSVLRLTDGCLLDYASVKADPYQPVTVISTAGATSPSATATAALVQNTTGAGGSNRQPTTITVISKSGAHLQLRFRRDFCNIRYDGEDEVAAGTLRPDATTSAVAAAGTSSRISPRNNATSFSGIKEVAASGGSFVTEHVRLDEFGNLTTHDFLFLEDVATMAVSTTQTSAKGGARAAAAPQSSSPPRRDSSRGSGGSWDDDDDSDGSDDAAGERRQQRRMASLIDDPEDAAELAAMNLETDCDGDDTNDFYYFNPAAPSEDLPAFTAFVAGDLSAHLPPPAASQIGPEPPVTAASPEICTTEPSSITLPLGQEPPPSPQADSLLHPVAPVTVDGLADTGLGLPMNSAASGGGLSQPSSRRQSCVSVDSGSRGGGGGSRSLTGRRSVYDLRSASGGGRKQRGGAAAVVEDDEEESLSGPLLQRIATAVAQHRERESAILAAMPTTPHPTATSAAAANSKAPRRRPQPPQTARLEATAQRPRGALHEPRRPSQKTAQHDESKRSVRTSAATATARADAAGEALFHNDPTSGRISGHGQVGSDGRFAVRPTTATRRYGSLLQHLADSVAGFRWGGSAMSAMATVVERQRDAAAAVGGTGTTGEPRRACAQPRQPQSLRSSKGPAPPRPDVPTLRHALRSAQPSTSTAVADGAATPRDRLDGCGELAPADHVDVELSLASPVMSTATKGPDNQSVVAGVSQPASPTSGTPVPPSSTRAVSSVEERPSDAHPMRPPSRIDAVAPSTAAYHPARPTPSTPIAAAAAVVAAPTAAGPRERGENHSPSASSSSTNAYSSDHDIDDDDADPRAHKGSTGTGRSLDAYSDDAARLERLALAGPMAL